MSTHVRSSVLPAVVACCQEIAKYTALPGQFGGKAPGQNWENMVDFTSKFEEINDIEHNKGTKIYPQNQVILDCIMPSIPLYHKCLR